MSTLLVFLVSVLVWCWTSGWVCRIDCQLASFPDGLLCFFFCHSCADYSFFWSHILSIRDSKWKQLWVALKFSPTQNFKLWFLLPCYLISKKIPCYSTWKIVLSLFICVSFHFVLFHVLTVRNCYSHETIRIDKWRFNILQKY